jgi:hypothetical protein
MARAGYLALVRKGGFPTAITGEACELVSGSVNFRITSAARRVIDPNTAWHLKVGAATLAYTGIVDVNFVSGEIQLAAHTNGSALTFSGNYIPITTSSDLVLEARDFQLSDSTNLLDSTVFTGTTDRTRKRTAGLDDVDFTVETIASRRDLASLSTMKFNGDSVVVEVYFGNASDPRFRGFCRIESIETSGNVDDLLSTSVGFKIAAVRHGESGQVATYDFTIQPNS